MAVYEIELYEPAGRQVTGLALEAPIGSGPFVGAFGIAVERNAMIVLGDGGNGGLIRVDPETGDRQFFSNIGYGVGPEIIDGGLLFLVVPEPAAALMMLAGAASLLIARFVRPVPVT